MGIYVFGQKEFKELPDEEKNYENIKKILDALRMQLSQFLIDLSLVIGKKKVNQLLRMSNRPYSALSNSVDFQPQVLVKLSKYLNKSINKALYGEEYPIELPKAVKTFLLSYMKLPETEQIAVSMLMSKNENDVENLTHQEMNDIIYQRILDLANLRDIDPKTLVKGIDIVHQTQFLIMLKAGTCSFQMKNLMYYALFMDVSLDYLCRVDYSESELYYISDEGEQVFVDNEYKPVISKFLRLSELEANNMLATTYIKANVK